MAIASLNVNGIRSHLDEVKLMMKRLGIHILGLNESKLDNSVPKELTKVLGTNKFALIGPVMVGEFLFTYGTQSILSPEMIYQ